jgi:hypothetical protein
VIAPSSGVILKLKVGLPMELNSHSGQQYLRNSEALETFQGLDGNFVSMSSGLILSKFESF